MKQFDWQRALEASPEPFHTRVRSVLSALPEQEEMTMKKAYRVKRIGALAAAAVLVLSIGVAAANNLGFIRTDSKNSRALKDPAAVVEVLEHGEVEGIGANAKFLEAYSNGFAFAAASLDGVEARGNEDPTVYSYQSVEVRYTRGSAAVDVDISPLLPGINDAFSGTAVDCGGVTLYAQERDYLVVPPDYEKTPAELEAEAAGTLMFSYDDGLDAPQAAHQCYVSWLQDGMRYSVSTMDGLTELDELISMARELIGA